MEDFLTTTFKSARIQSHTWPPCGRTPPLRAHSHRAGRQGGKGAVAEARGQGRQLLMGRAPPRGSRRWFVQRSTDPCFGLNEPRETFRQLRPVTLIGSDWGWRNEVGTKGRATAAQRTSPQSRWEPRQSALAHPSPSPGRNVWSLRCRRRGSRLVVPCTSGGCGHGKAPPCPVPLQK